MTSMRARSKPAGCTISAASTPSKAPCAGHQDLAAAALLGGCAHHDDPSTELLGERGRRQPGAEPGGGDDVVTAGVADAREGVVLAEHGDRWVRWSRPGR